MLLSRDPLVIDQYLSDEGNAHKALPERVSAVFYPESEEDIVEIIKSADNSPVNVSGAGTGITGSRVPIHGGIVVSMERMLRARAREGCSEIGITGAAGNVKAFLDTGMNIAHVAPGVSLSDLDNIVPRGWMYPPDPTETLASIGGTVATNASGARSFFYGSTRKWIAGLRIVLADAEVLDIKRGTTFADENGMLSFSSESGKRYCTRIPNYQMLAVKNAAGLYSTPGMDLIDLFIGSEGILGVVSEVSIKLSPSSGEPVTDIAFFREQSDAMRFVGITREMKGRGVLAIEYFDENALNFIRDQHPEIPEGTGAAVLVEVGGKSLEVLAKLSANVGSCNAMADWCANNSVDRRDMKEFRHSLPESVNSYLKRHESYKLGTDFAVPPERFAEMMEHYRDAGRRFESGSSRGGPHCVTFGHIGDCHVHFNFIASDRGERDTALEIYRELAMKAVALGGTVSAEHGVGKKNIEVDGKQVPYIQLMYGEGGLQEIARVKAALDPNGILNPGNMVPAGLKGTG